MTRLLTIAVLVLIITSPAAAQSACGNGLPCGPIPWPLPAYTNLQSPTPMPTIVVVATVFPTQTPIPTATPQSPPTQPPAATNTPMATATATPTDAFSPDEINDSISTISAWGAATLPAISVSGTPGSSSQIFATLGANAGDVFGYARGLSESNFAGRLSPFIAFTLLALITVITINLLIFAIPLISTLIGIVRKIVELILELLPL